MVVDKENNDDQIRLRARLSRDEKLIKVYRELAAEDPEDAEVREQVADLEAKIGATSSV